MAELSPAEEIDDTEKIAAIKLVAVAMILHGGFVGEIVAPYRFNLFK